MDLKFHSDNNRKAILIMLVENNLVKYLSVAYNETGKAVCLEAILFFGASFSGLLPMFTWGRLHENRNFIAS